MVMLTSCSFVREESVLLGETEQLSSDVLSEKKYKASRSESLSIYYDYDTVTNMCIDACKEFVNAVSTDSIDFSAFISNPLLITYMEYRVKNYPFDYEGIPKVKYFITSVEFADDYAVVKGCLGILSGPSEAMEGEVYFVLSNEQGNIVIRDWYWNYIDSPDVLYRGVFMPEENLDYWNNSDKYNSFMKSLSLENK